MNHLLPLLLFLASFGPALWAQPASKEVTSSCSGRWEGVLTQKKGGFIPEYRMVLVLSVSGDEVSGLSEVWYGESLYVKSEIRGTVTRGLFLELEDHQVLNKKDLRDFEYCRKRYQLMLDRAGEGYVLKGRWQGETDRGACVPGTIRLERRTSRV